MNAVIGNLTYYLRKLLL